MTRWWQRPLELRGRRGPADVLVVLGAALAPDGGLGVALAERVAAGAAAFRAGMSARMIVTGALEAGAMRERAVALGVPREAILTEGTARTTRENALASAALMRAHGLSTALIVTQPYHLRRSVMAFRRMGIDAHPLVIHERADPLRLVAREYVAWCAYALRGWV